MDPDGTLPGSCSQSFWNHRHRRRPDAESDAFYYRPSTTKARSGTRCARNSRTYDDDFDDDYTIRRLAAAAASAASASTTNFSYPRCRVTRRYNRHGRTDASTSNCLNNIRNNNEGPPSTAHLNIFRNASSSDGGDRYGDGRYEDGRDEKMTKK